MPLESPLAAMVVFSGLSPMRESGFWMWTSSAYMPAETVIVSPLLAAVTAAEIVVKQPDLPCGLTHSVAASAEVAIARVKVTAKMAEDLKRLTGSLFRKFRMP